MDLREDCSVPKPQGGDNNDNDNGNNNGIIKSNVEVKKCSDCQTTTTPLWRGGPAGPKVEVTPGSNPHRPTQDPLPLNPPIASSPKLGHTEVGLHSKPNTHHTRQNSTHSPQPQPGPTPEVACAGLDVNPWPDDDDDTDQKAQHEDNKEYFKDHKASPLSEVEFADSRKPVSQATDTNTSVGGPILFNEEQQDTAEGSLMRAAEIFKWNKMRGDPDSPHGRVLRELRGEFW